MRCHEAISFQHAAKRLLEKQHFKNKKKKIFIYIYIQVLSLLLYISNFIYIVGLAV